MSRRILVVVVIAFTPDAVTVKYMRLFSNITFSGVVGFTVKVT